MIWYVLVTLLALLLLLLLVPLSLSVKMNEQGELKLRARVLGICVYRSPKRAKRVRLSDYSPHALRRREKKAERARQRALSRAQKKKATAPSTAPSSGEPLISQISSVTELVSLIARRTLFHARVRVDALAITVATPDAARTALLYGAACSALAFLTEALHQFSHLHISHPEHYGIAADFSSEHSRADVRIHFRLHVHHVVRIAAHTLAALIRRNIKSKKRHNTTTR
jgi:hypothetical protein